MVYIYNCQCGNEFEVIKSVRQIDDIEPCAKCDSIETKRIICCRGGFYGEKGWDDYQWNPGLGAVTRNAKHRAEIAKSKNLVEIGNEDCEKIMNEQDKKLEAADNERHEKAMEPVVYGINEALRKSK